MLLLRKVKLKQKREIMLTPKEYKNRLIDKKVDDYLKTFGAVLIEGPKWCGKTWCALNHSESVCYLADPNDDFSNRTRARLNPAFVLDGERPRLIDEWQDVPSIWDAVRFEVDKETSRGHFILTGSSTPEHKGILHSGTGRFGRIRMHTMSLYETGDSSGVASIKEMFETGSIQPAVSPDVDLKRLIYYVVRGGWPGSLNYPEEMARQNTKEYLENVITDDMFKVDGIKRDARKVRSLLHSLGRNESTVVSNKTLAGDVKEYDNESIETATISEYLSIFQRLFLIDDQPAYNAKLRSSRRVLKSPKRHFADPSLAVAALSATPEMLYQDLKTFGFLFESLCEHDLKIYAESMGASLFHFRDWKGNEVDAVIELPDGTTGIFEIKLGMNQVDEAAENLKRIQSILDNEGTKPKIMGVIVGIGSTVYQRDDGVFVLPITALKD